MQEQFEKKLKAFLPYIIIIGVVYLIAPALLLTESNFFIYLVLIGILPLTAGGCCAHYSMKKENDFWLCLVAPIFFIPAMFLYGIFQANALRALIYLVAYLLCGYLGLALGDILSVKDKEKRAAVSSGKEKPDDRKPVRKPADRKPARKTENRGVDPDVPIRRSSSAARADRVDLDSTEDFVTEDPYEDNTLDTSTTSDDIDAILSEIHQRRGNE